MTNLLFTTVLLLSFFKCSCAQTFINTTNTIQELLLILQRNQVSQSVTTYIPPFSWARDYGAYESSARLNVLGNPFYTLFRNFLFCYDNNIFATAWVTTNLLESAAYGKTSLPSDNQIHSAIENINTYEDRNYPAGSGVISFWPQLFNDSSKLWVSSPKNLFGFFHYIIDLFPWNASVELFNLMSMKSLARIIQIIKEIFSKPASWFHLPGDFDDSFLRFGLGGLLSELNILYPASYESWEMKSKNIEILFQALKKYAYRPFEKDFNSNAIDTRTYFYLHPFLEDCKAKNLTLALIPTWIHNFKETMAQRPSVNMPYFFNNVDVNVCSNVLYGINKGLLEDLGNTTEWFDESIEMIYLNTTSMLAWAIDTDIVEKRKDLALIYYPAIYTFYFFISRSLFQLETSLANNKRLPQPAMNQAYKILSATLRNKGYQQILSRAKFDERKRLYFEDFLGNADKTFFSMPQNNADDRLFSTAMAINGLLSTWTFYNRTTWKLNWVKDTPNNVKESIHLAVTWLNDNILSSNYKTLNAFFSASVKSFVDLPYLYPANYIKYVNGSDVPPGSIPSDDLVVGMSGVISSTEYETMVNESHFGHPTPIDFPGYNSEKDLLLFWSSSDFTYSSALQALSWYSNIQ